MFVAWIAQIFEHLKQLLWINECLGTAFRKKRIQSQSFLPRRDADLICSQTKQFPFLFKKGSSFTPTPPPPPPSMIESNLDLTCHEWIFSHSYKDRILFDVVEFPVPILVRSLKQSL